MSHTVKVYTYESIAPPDVQEHPKTRLVLTHAMQAAGMHHQWCCRPMDMEPLKSNGLTNEVVGKGWLWNECRWCGSVWRLDESTDGNNETFYSYSEAEAPPQPALPEKKVMLPSTDEIGKYGPCHESNIAMPKQFSIGIRCPDCEGVITKDTTSGNYGCNKCTYGHAEPQSNPWCKQCMVGKMRPTGDNYFRMQCNVCGAQSEHV